MVRPNKDDYYIMIAEAVSARSTCFVRRYGAVIVNNDEIIAAGYNGFPRSEKNCVDLDEKVCSHQGTPHNSGDYSSCGAVHAEQNAMLSASRREMLGATLYLSGFEEDDFGDSIRIKEAEPCPVCMRMIKNSGIDRVVNWYGTAWKRGDADVRHRGTRL